MHTLCRVSYCSPSRKRLRGYLLYGDDLVHCLMTHAWAQTVHRDAVTFKWP